LNWCSAQNKTDAPITFVIRPNGSFPSGAAPTEGACEYSFLVPTRNNLPGLQKLFDSILATTANPQALEVVLAIDEDDVATQSVSDDRLCVRKLVVPKGLTMGALNNQCFEASSGRHIMLMNDDVVLRTKGWDRHVSAVFASFQDEIALVHLNDLLFRERLCTFPMLSRRACQAIGLCPTAYRRYRIDDHIYDTYNLLAHLGYGRIVYLPEVIFEHENHASEAAPAGNHQFASTDKKVYVPKAGIIEEDAKYCDEHFADRKAAALKLAEIIETDAHRRAIEALQRGGSARLAAASDSYSYRRPAYVQVRPTGAVRDSRNARTTIAIVTADVNGEVARRCLAAIKQHTRNYDLVILDNNRGPNFSHPREMNRVLQTCGTEFLVLLDDDVFVEAGWLDGLLRCMDEDTGVVVPLHKDRAGAISFSGIYFTGDRRGTHAHTLDRPQAPRVIQSYCSAAMLIDMRKCGHLRMDESYHKYFFDLVHGFEVWEAGWKAVCCPDVIVTHLGGATMTWGSAEANAFHEKDASVFVRGWIDNGRMARLQEAAWQRHPSLAALDKLPRQIESFVAQAPSMSQGLFEKQLAETVKACAPFKLLTHRLVAGLAQRAQAFEAKGDIQRIVLSCQLVAQSNDSTTEIDWLLATLGPLFQAKQFQAADKLLQSSLQRHSTNVALWRALGITRLRAGEMTGALSAFEQALVCAPEDVECQGGLGMVLFELQQPSEAADRFEEALRLCRKNDPKDSRIAMLSENLKIARQQASKFPSVSTKCPARPSLTQQPVSPVAQQSPAAPLTSAPTETVRPASSPVQARFAPRQSTPTTPTGGVTAPVPDQSAGARFGGTLVEPVLQPAPVPTKRQCILLIPFECANWQNARAWSYTGYFAFEEGLQAAGVDFFTLPAVAGFASDHPASWLKYARELCRGQEFDQAWIWVTHNEYRPEFFEWLAGIAPVRVGVIMESLQHTPEELRSYRLLPGRQERVGTMLRHMTHVLAFDEEDAEALAADLPLRALWCPPIVPARSVCQAVDLPAPGPAIFNGTLYSAERRSFLQHPRFRQKLMQPPLPEDQTDLPARFDAAQLQALNLLAERRGPSVPELQAHVAEVREVRRQMFALWLQALRAGYATVNLPSVYKGYAGRVVESMAAGRPVISWTPPRARTCALFAPEQEILLFDRKKPEELHRQIDRLQKDPAFAQSLAERAREKVLRCHTAEVRVRQILDWVEHDTQPDYGEGTRPAEVISVNTPGMSAKALAAAELLVERSSEDAGAWTGVARTALQAGRVERFETALDRARELNPDGRDVLKLLGDLCVREGQVQNAVQNYYRILQSHPDDVPVLYSMGFTLEQAGEWESAFSVYDHLIRLVPSDAVLAERVARLRKAREQASVNPAPPSTESSGQVQPATPAVKAPARAPSKVPTRASQDASNKVAFKLPLCALVGHIGPARELLAKRKLAPAWQSALGAINARPYHPEAYLVLAEIAQAAGDSVSARLCAHHARKLAPGWKPAKKFFSGKLRGTTRPDWLVLPEALALASSNGKTSAGTRLSVCLIAKNEERFLGQCLQSVRALADQVVLVDTGSTDRTVEIATEHGAEVHHFAWCDDFSAARNAALEHATGDWILMLDVDEELTPAKHESLRKLLQNPEVMAYRLPIIDVGRENEGCCYVPRLFRNAPALFYVGRVHEQVFTSIEVRRQEWGLDNRLGAATLRHHGYLPEVVKDRNKIERNLRLLEKAIVELPDEPSLLMNYGLELARSGQLETGIEHYRKAFDLMSAQAPSLVIPETREMLLTQFCTQLTALRRFDEIIRVLTSPLAQSGGLTASLHFALGLAHLELKQPSEAADQMRQCLAKRSQPSLSPINTEIHKAGPHHCLALCVAQLGDTDAAAAEFCLAIEDDPQSRPARFDYARLLAARNQSVEALNLLFKLAKHKADDSAVWLLGGQIALSRPEFLEVALDWTADAGRHFPQDLAILRQRAEVLTLANRCEEALPLWRRIRPESAPALAAALVLCETAANDDQFSPPMHLEAQISREFLKWYQRLIQFNNRSTVEAVNARIDSLQSRLPSVAHVLREALAQASVAVAA
jgi:tetratricopeptide (TPR) repeat protein